MKSPRRRAKQRDYRALVAAAGVAIAATLAAIAGLFVNLSASPLPPSAIDGLIGPAAASALTFRYADLEGKPDARLTAAAVTVAPRATLAFEPFLIAGTAARTSDPRRADALLNEALRRRPRLREVRNVNLQYGLATNDVPRVIGALNDLARLDGMNSNAAAIIEQVGKATVDAAQLDAMMDAFRPYPWFYESYLRGLQSSPAGVALVGRLAQRVPRQQLVRDANLRNVLVIALVNAGQFREARSVGAIGATRRSPEPPFYVGTSDPFGWQFADGGLGTASIEPNGSLYVDYFGRVGGALAIRLLTLPPGPHRVTIVYQGEAAPEPRISLEVGCKGAGSLMVSELLQAALDKRVTRTIDFAVPASCIAQEVRLVASPGERRVGQQLRVFDFSLDKGARQ